MGTFSCDPITVLRVDAREMLLTTPAGVRKPIDGQYSIVIARGTGEEEIVLPATLAGFCELPLE